MQGGLKVAANDPFDASVAVPLRWRRHVGNQATAHI
jgi:hypothetical protein